MVQIAPLHYIEFDKITSYNSGPCMHTIMYTCEISFVANTIIS